MAGYRVGGQCLGFCVAQCNVWGAVTILEWQSGYLMCCWKLMLVLLRIFLVPSSVLSFSHGTAKQT